MDYPMFMLRNNKKVKYIHTTKTSSCSISNYPKHQIEMSSFDFFLFFLFFFRTILEYNQIQ